MAGELVFGRMQVGSKAKQRRSKPDVKALYFSRLFAEEDNDPVILPPAEQPVQLGMFTL